MDDLISRSALIEKFDADFQAGLIESWDDVIGTIEEAPTADNNVWIPCSEMLPKKQRTTCYNQHRHCWCYAV